MGCAKVKPNFCPQPGWWVSPRSTHRRDRSSKRSTRIREMESSDDAAYARAALSATVVLFRTLIKKGLLTRDEVVRVVLDEAVSRAIQAESQDAREAGSDANRKCAEILKLIAEKL